MAFMRHASTCAALVFVFASISCKSTRQSDAKTKNEETIDNYIYLPIVNKGDEVVQPERTEATLRQWIETTALDCASGGCGFAFVDTGAHGLVAADARASLVPDAPQILMDNQQYTYYGYDVNTPRLILSSIKFMIAGYGVYLGIPDAEPDPGNTACTNFKDDLRAAIVDSDNEATSCLMSYIAKKLGDDLDPADRITKGVEEITNHFSVLSMQMSGTDTAKSHFCRWRGNTYKHFFPHSDASLLHLNKFRPIDSIYYLLHVKAAWNTYFTRLLEVSKINQAGLAWGSSGTAATVYHKVGYESPGSRTDIALFGIFGHIVGAVVQLERANESDGTLERRIRMMGCAIRKFYLGEDYETCDEDVPANVADAEAAMFPAQTGEP